jgi:hypothetical protein
MLSGVLAASLFATPVGAQTTGRIVGRIIDAGTGQPLSGAQVTLAGTDAGSLSGVDGRYTLIDVPAGERAVTVTCLGYGEKTVEGIRVEAGQAAVQDVSLSTAAIAPTRTARGSSA